MTIPRRLLSEIITRYKLEPHLDDIYVEGSTDKKLIDKALHHLSVDRPVYEIDTIEISGECLEKYGFTRGNRQELATLCFELALPKASSVRFLIDKDMDHHLGMELAGNGLRYTDNCDLEGVFLDEEGVKKMVCDAGAIKCHDWPSLYESIESVVKMIYSLRLSLFEISYDRKLPSFNKSLEKQGSKIRLDVANLVSRCNALPMKFDNVVTRALDWAEKLDHFSAKDAGRGHDFLEILEWTVKKFNGHKSIAESLPHLLVLFVPEKAEVIVAPLSK